MLRHLDEGEAADRLERALAAVIAEGKSVTYDMKPSGRPHGCRHQRRRRCRDREDGGGRLMPRVTVVGAGKYGSTTVQRLAAWASATRW